MFCLPPPIKLYTLVIALHFPPAIVEALPTDVWPSPGIKLLLLIKFSQPPPIVLSLLLWMKPSAPPAIVARCEDDIQLSNPPAIVEAPEFL